MKKIKLTPDKINLVNVSPPQFFLFTTTLVKLTGLSLQQHNFLMKALLSTQIYQPIILTSLLFVSGMAQSQAAMNIRFTPGTNTSEALVALSGSLTLYAAAPTTSSTFRISDDFGIWDSFGTTINNPDRVSLFLISGVLTPGWATGSQDVNTPFLSGSLQARFVTTGGTELSTVTMNGMTWTASDTFDLHLPSSTTFPNVSDGDQVEFSGSALIQLQNGNFTDILNDITVSDSDGYNGESVTITVDSTAPPAEPSAPIPEPTSLVYLFASSLLLTRKRN